MTFDTQEELIGAVQEMIEGVSRETRVKVFLEWVRKF
jgi:hypothetical protein